MQLVTHHHLMVCNTCRKKWAEMEQLPVTAKGHPYYPQRTKEQREADREELTLALQNGISPSAFWRNKNLPRSYVNRLAKEIREEHAAFYQKRQQEAIGTFILRHEKVINTALQKAFSSPTWASVAASTSEGMIRTLQSLGVLPKRSEVNVAIQNNFVADFNQAWEEVNDYAKRVAEKQRPAST